MDIYSMLDIMEILIGAYLLFLAIRMKKTGVLSDNGLVSKGIDLEKAKDPEGYIKIMFPWNLLLGILLIIFGLASRYLSTNDAYDYLQNTLTIISVITILVYGFCSMKAQKKYLEP